jgi:hypothetical protein
MTYAVGTRISFHPETAQALFESVQSTLYPVGTRITFKRLQAQLKAIKRIPVQFE